MPLSTREALRCSPLTEFPQVSAIAATGNLSLVEAMGEKGGNLTIGTSEIQRRVPLPGMGTERKRFVRIQFEDEGPGIPPHVMERLFIPFFTTKRGGTGLGLAICQRIVRSLGGSIEVRSRTGSGSVFSVLLPMDAAPRDRPHTSPSQAPE